VSLSACEPPPARGPAAAHAEYEADTEYQEGLSHVLELARTSYGAGVLTRIYGIGYTTGRFEGAQVVRREAGEMAETGCLAKLTELSTVRPGDAPDATFCNSLTDASVADAKYSGALFVSGRLVVVKKGVETGDQTIKRELLHAYQEGYAGGFIHENDPVKGSETRMVKAFKSGCVRAILFADKRTPIMDDLAKPLLASCDAGAADFARTYEAKLAAVKRARGE
jgi:hypothetical protein